MPYRAAGGLLYWRAYAQNSASLDLSALRCECCIDTVASLPGIFVAGNCRSAKQIAGRVMWDSRGDAAMHVTQYTVKGMECYQALASCSSSTARQLQQSGSAGRCVRGIGD